MRNTRCVSVLLVAAVSAAVQGGLAIMFVPALSFLFAVTGNSAAATASNTVLEYGMTMAIVAPILCAVFGFAMGAFMAFMFNMFANPKSESKIVLEERSRARSASASNAA